MRARKRGRYTATTSPDAGAQSAQYDALGLPRQIIDALGQATNITRHGFGRVTKKTQQLAPFSAGTAKTVQYSYATSTTGQGAGNGQINSKKKVNGVNGVVNGVRSSKWGQIKFSTPHS